MLDSRDMAVVAPLSIAPPADCTDGQRSAGGTRGDDAAILAAAGASSAQVRKPPPSWPRSLANFSPLWLYSHRNACASIFWANLTAFSPSGVRWAVAGDAGRRENTLTAS